MKSTVTRFIPFLTHEFEPMESWLCHMASRGLFLESAFLLWGTFEKGTPCDRKYRVIPKASGSACTEEKEIYAACDWHYVCTKGDLNIFYTDNKTAPEIFTDSSTFKSHLKRYVWLSLILLALILFWTFKIVQGVMALQDVVEGPVTFLIRTGALAATFLVLLIIAAFVSVIRYSLKTIFIIYRSARGKELRHNMPYKKTAFCNRLEFFSILIIAAGLAVGIIVSHNFPYTVISTEKTLSFCGDRPVMLKEIDPESWEKLQRCIDSEAWSESVDYSADEYSDALFKKIVNICTDTDDTIFRSNYYEARHEKIAAQFVKEELSYYVKQGDTIYDLKEFRPAETSGLDYAGYWEEDDGYQYLCLRVGTRIETVSYSGSEKLLEHLEVFADDIL